MIYRCDQYVKGYGRKGRHMHEQRGSLRSEMETMSTSPKKMLEIKDTIAKTKSASVKLLITPDTVEGKITKT